MNTILKWIISLVSFYLFFYLIQISWSMWFYNKIPFWIAFPTIVIIEFILFAINIKMWDLQ